MAVAPPVAAAAPRVSSGADVVETFLTESRLLFRLGLCFSAVGMAKSNFSPSSKGVGRKECSRSVSVSRVPTLSHGDVILFGFNGYDAQALELNR